MRHLRNGSYDAECLREGMVHMGSVKGKIGYVLFIILGMLVLWFADEGRKPIVYEGAQLQYSAGAPDSENALYVNDTVVQSGIVASTPQYLMNKGTYEVTVQYLAEEDGSVLELWEQGTKIAGWPMDYRKSVIEQTFTLSKDAKQLQMRINYGGSGSLTVKEMELSPEGCFYTDTYYMMAVFLLVNLCGYRICQCYRKGKLSQRTLTDGAVIIGVTLLAMSPMFQTYLYNGNDLCYHLARLEGIKDGILDGQIGVNILPEGLQGNGYLNAMYPYLFLYIGAFLRICRVSIALSYKTIVFFATLGAALSAYYAVRSITQSRRSVILATVLYTLMPYRFTNIFSRGDLGETLALAFWPLLLAGLYHVCMGDRKKWYFLVIAFGGILQSHILSAAIAAAVCVLTALLYVVHIIREKRYIEVGKAVGLTLLLNAWYLIPFCTYYYAGELNKEVLRWSSYFEQSINLSNMTQSISLYNKQYFSLGMALLGCVGIGVIYLVIEGRQEKKELTSYLWYLLILGGVLVYMTTGYFPNREMLDHEFLRSVITMLQFPWRFLGPASACFVLVGAVGISDSVLLKPYRNVIFGMLIGLNLLVIVSVPSDNNHKPYSNAEAVASKGHESKLAANVGIFYPYEWRLEGSPDDKLTTSVVTSSAARIRVEQYEKKGTKAAVAYRAEGENLYIELPIQKYLGYYASDENGAEVALQEGDGMRIRLAAEGDGELHTVYVRYGPVPAFVAGDLISFLTIAGIVLLQFFRRRGHLRKLS